MNDSEGSLKTMEQRMDQLEKRNKRLTVSLTMTVVAMCAVVTMAATGEKNAEFDTVIARSIYVTNDAGDFVVTLDANDSGTGVVETHSAKGKTLVKLTATVEDEGAITTYHPNGKALVKLTATVEGEGAVTTYHPNALDGRRVAVRAVGLQRSGLQRVEWDGRDESGGLLSPGLYLLGLEIEGEATALKQMVPVGVAY